jgi:hypothetical protein
LLLHSKAFLKGFKELRQEGETKLTLNNPKVVKKIKSLNLADVKRNII